MTAGRRLMGFTLVVLGLTIALPFGMGVVMDLFLDNYPDTWRDHLKPLGIVGAGVVTAAYGARQVRAGASPVSGGKLAGGFLLLLLAVVVAFFLTGICGLGCQTSEYVAGVVVLALVGAAGVLFAFTGRNVARS